MFTPSVVSTVFMLLCEMFINYQLHLAHVCLETYQSELHIRSHKPVSCLPQIKLDNQLCVYYFTMNTFITWFTSTEDRIPGTG